VKQPRDRKTAIGMIVCVDEARSHNQTARFDHACAGRYLDLRALTSSEDRVTLQNNDRIDYRRAAGAVDHRCANDRDRVVSRLRSKQRSG
jgi:hypothetical protein